MDWFLAMIATLLTVIGVAYFVFGCSIPRYSPDGWGDIALACFSLLLAGMVLAAAVDHKTVETLVMSTTLTGSFQPSP